MIKGILKNGKIIKFTKNHPDFKGIKFVIKALSKSKSEHRHHVKNLFFDNGIIVGTNGKQLNVYEPTFKYLNGLYEIVMNGASIIVLQRLTNGKTAKSLYPPYKKSFDQKITTNIDIRYECELEFSKACSEIYKNMVVNFLDIRLLECIPYGQWTAGIVNEDNGHTSMIILENKRDHLTSLVMAVLG